MNAEIRRWVQTATGLVLLAYALLVEKDASRRQELIGVGCVLIDGEHVLKQIGLWKGA